MAFNPKTDLFPFVLIIVIVTVLFLGGALVLDLMK
jgi:hypothetical protein